MLRRPFIYFPLEDHFEQNLVVAKRLARHGAGQRLLYSQTSPERLAEAVYWQLGRDAIGRDPLGRASVGLALPYCPGSFRALCCQAGQRSHKKITEWAWQLLLQVRRWYSQREIVAVADRAYAALKLLDRCRSLRDPITFITRLDGALYEPGPPRRPGQIGRPRLKGERLPNLSVVAQDPKTSWKPTKIANWYGSEDRTVEIASQTAVWYSTGLFAVPIRWVLVRDPEGNFKTQALVCTDLDADPQKILSWFVMRWQLEVTFQEMRRHLGFESQRQWSDMAIRRTRLALLGLFSLDTLFAHGRMRQAAGVLWQTAWYRKRDPWAYPK